MGARHIRMFAAVAGSALSLVVNAKAVIQVNLHDLSKIAAPSDVACHASICAKPLTKDVYIMKVAGREPADEGKGKGGGGSGSGGGGGTK